MNEIPYILTLEMLPYCNQGFECMPIISEVDVSKGMNPFELIISMGSKFEEEMNEGLKSYGKFKKLLDMFLDNPQQYLLNEIKGKDGNKLWAVDFSGRAGIEKEQPDYCIDDFFSNETIEEDNTEYKLLKILLDYNMPSGTGGRTINMQYPDRILRGEDNKNDYVLMLGGKDHIIEGKEGLFLPIITEIEVHESIFDSIKNEAAKVDKKVETERWAYQHFSEFMARFKKNPQKTIFRRMNDVNGWILDIPIEPKYIYDHEEVFRKVESSDFKKQEVDGFSFKKLEFCFNYLFNGVM